jgi:SNF2 family DNA or RNA helicase
MIDEFGNIKWYYTTRLDNTDLKLIYFLIVFLCILRDYAILDEGHTIRNPSTQMFKALQQLKTEHRLLLTGTPVQNKLKELWALMSWATKGFVEHINRGQDPKASEDHVRVSKIVAESLLKILRPVLLQRKKCEKQELLKVSRIKMKEHSMIDNRKNLHLGI